jgi:surface protein
MKSFNADLLYCISSFIQKEELSALLQVNKHIRNEWIRYRYISLNRASSILYSKDATFRERILSLIEHPSRQLALNLCECDDASGLEGVHTLRRRVCITDTNIRAAVERWFDDRGGAEEEFGPIGEWHTSRVTRMPSLFMGRLDFNEDLSGWDVSSVVNMDSMFYHASSFNQDLSGWDVSSVNDMINMFNGASFQSIRQWMGCVECK